MLKTRTAALLAALACTGAGCAQVPPSAAYMPPPPAYAPHPASYGEEHALSPSDDAELNRLLARKDEEIMGPPRRNFIHFGFVGDQAGHQPVPPGCQERQVQEGPRVFVRVECPHMRPPAGLHRMEW